MIKSFISLDPLNFQNGLQCNSRHALINLNGQKILKPQEEMATVLCVIKEPEFI